MLPGDNPDFQITFDLVAYGQQVDVAPFDGAAQVVYLTQAAALRVAQQVEVLLGGIGFEIGVVHAVGQGRVFDGQHAVFVTGGHAEPVLAVVGGARLIVFPARRIGGRGGVFKAHDAILISRALKAEIKPLGEIRSIVGTDGKADVLRVGQVVHDDRAAVESGGDFQHKMPGKKKVGNAVL